MDEQAPVVIGYDDSDFSREALRKGLWLASKLGAKARIVRAWTISNAPRPSTWEPGYVPPVDDFATAVRIYRTFGSRTQLGFGIGTSLTNDVGLTPLNIVMKLTSANGQPVAKLSDSPGKTLCDDQTFLAYLRQVFGVPAA